MMSGKRKGRKQELEASAAAFLAAIDSPRASDRLRDHGLQRVMARAKSDEPVKVPASRRTYRNPAHLRHALAVAMVVLLVMLVSTSGAYAFSLDAQPGSSLYGAKIFFERARVTLNPSRTGDIHLEMTYSERRMEEMHKMVASSDREGAERWLREYSRNIEGAGILFEKAPDREASELSLQFHEMLDRQAQIMQGMREGQPAGLSEPIEEAYRVCDRERERMRQRCGQQDPGGSVQEPGGQGPQDQGNCPRSEDSSSGKETPSTTTKATDDNSGPCEEPAPSSSAPGDTTTDMPPDSPSSQTSPSANAQAGGDGHVAADIGYQDGSPHKGHVP